MPTSSFDNEFILSEQAVLRLNNILQKQENKICKDCKIQKCYPDNCEILHPELKEMCDLMCPETQEEYEEDEEDELEK